MWFFSPTTLPPPTHILPTHYDKLNGATGGILPLMKLLWTKNLDASTLTSFNVAVNAKEGDGLYIRVPIQDFILT